MKLEHRHSFTQEEAVARIKALTDYWSKKYGVQCDWQADSAHIKGNVKGVSFDGTFDLKPSLLAAEVKVGFLAERLGGKAYVERKLTEYLDPKNSLDSLKARV